MEGNNLKNWVANIYNIYILVRGLLIALEDNVHNSICMVERGTTQFLYFCFGASETFRLCECGFKSQCGNAETYPDFTHVSNKEGKCLLLKKDWKIYLFIKKYRYFITISPKRKTGNPPKYSIPR